MHKVGLALVLQQKHDAAKRCDRLEVESFLKISSVNEVLRTWRTTGSEINVAITSVARHTKGL